MLPKHPVPNRPPRPNPHHPFIFVIKRNGMQYPLIAIDCTSTTPVRAIRYKRPSTTLEEVDTPNLNGYSVIPDDIVSNKDIDTAIGALTEHMRTVVNQCQRKVSANSDRQGLSTDVRKLIRAKNAALRRVSSYPTPEYSTRVRSTLSLFANDTALYLRCSNFRQITPCLQKAIDELTRWIQTWRIEVNPEKSAAIFFNYNKIKPAALTTTIENLLELSEKVRSLLKQTDSLTSFTKNADGTWTYKVEVGGNVLLEETFGIGKEYDYTRPDGVVTKNTFTLEGDTLKQVMKDPEGKSLYIERAFSGDTMKLKVNADGIDITGYVEYQSV
ncbi:Fatty acid-binding protein, liver [Eumeta japonica]|uniref:Fatty acid-binding protein, liver n=1 Tax=Eumeta variegata TaxID=151549 RepID=A0A4C1XGB3_EUMVA|nr:Fatty acid-binding protein, liver [Eumeta japonica]